MTTLYPVNDTYAAIEHYPDLETAQRIERIRDAAPDLLAALEGIIDAAEIEAMERQDLVDCEQAQREADHATAACATARAAIARAKGE